MNIIQPGSRFLMLVADQLQIDRRVLHEAASLSSKGCNVIVISLVEGMNKPTNLPMGIEIVDARCLIEYEGHKKTAFTTLNIRSSIFKCLQKYLPRWVQEIGYFGLLDPARWMARNFAEMNIGEWDVVIAHDLPLLPLAVALRNKQGRGKIVLDAHELYDEQHDFLKTKTARRYWRRVEDEFLPFCDGVMTVTPRIASILMERHALYKIPTVLYNACPYEERKTDRNKLHKLYGIDPSRTVVLCQGGLSPGRSLEEFIEAWSYICEPRPALVFLGFGRDDYVNSLKKMVARKDLGRDVFLGKAVAPDQILDYTCSAKLGLISNRGQGINNTDGGPNRLFEYIQARVPVLSYEHNGVRQVLDKTGTGWVVKWESPQDLSKIILEKLEQTRNIDPGLLEKAARNFSWENEESKLLALIASLGEETGIDVRNSWNSRSEQRTTKEGYAKNTIPPGSGWTG